MHLMQEFWSAFLPDVLLSCIDRIYWCTVCVFICLQGAFFVPYVIFFICCGIPVFFLETALGQFTSEGGITCWRKVCPLFEGEKTHTWYVSSSMRLTLTSDEKADGRHISLADKCCLLYECLITTGAVKVAVIYKSCYYLHFFSNFLLLSASRFFFRHWLCNTGDWSSSKHILRSDPRLGHFLPLQLLHHWAAVGWLWALLEYR